MIWSVYMIRCADGSFYTGISTDVARRFDEHASGSPKSAKYVRGRGPLELIYVKELGNRSEASIEERRIKRLTKAQKICLLSDGKGRVRGRDQS
jgi:putative endonuclease